MPAIERRALVPLHFSDKVPPLLQRLYGARGASVDEDIDYQLKQLLPPDNFKGMGQAVSRLQQAFSQQQRVLIVGDFDADGATSCSLAMLALKAMGLHSIDYLVPNRFEYGYGLTPEIVDVAQEKQPDLIITVDNGIASVDGVDRANELGIDVIVTDHHLAPEQLPHACAIVNPNQPGCDFASKNLAGVGVVFYLMLALRARFRQTGWFKQLNIPEPNLGEYLDLVALGTVADVVPLDHNNRILVHQGLQRIRAGKTRLGILALLNVAGKQYQRIYSQDMGFIVGPRLNAAGRLDDMSIGIECLLTESFERANELALELDSLNKERRSIEASMQKEALDTLSQVSLSDTDIPWGLSLYDESWHQGVIGILASRIKDKYYRPVIAFASVDDDTIKGSARSIPGLHIRDLLDRIATRHPDLLQKFGGHAMAAGLSLKREHYPQFAELLDKTVREVLSEQDLKEVLYTDGELAEEEMNIASALTIQQAGPWGQQFSEPYFDGVFQLHQQRIVGEKHLKLVLSHPGKNQLYDGIFFNANLEQWPNENAQQVTLVYQLSVNHYRGEDRVQLIVKYIDKY